MKKEARFYEIIGKRANCSLCPLHISRYFPAYKMDAPPTTLDEFRKVYHKLKGKLTTVYLGNLSPDEKKYVEKKD